MMAKAQNSGITMTKENIIKIGPQACTPSLFWQCSTLPFAARVNQHNL
jgi:hypothetical protein